MEGGGNGSPRGLLMDRETRRSGVSLSGRKRLHSGCCVVHGSSSLSCVCRKPLTPECPFCKVSGGWCSCLWRIAIRDGMAPSEVDNGAAGYAGMTGARPHEDVSYSTRDNATKHAPRKQSRGRSARKRIVWKRKPM